MSLPPLRPDLAEGAIVMLRPERREIYGMKGERLRRPLIGVQLRYHECGPIMFEGGRLLAADPFGVDANSRSFALRIPPGSHRVFAVSANVTHGHRKCAFGGVQFESAAPTRYKLALFVGEFAWRVGKNASGGVGTDSAIASVLASSDLARLLTAPSDAVQQAIDATLEHELGGVARIPAKSGNLPIAVWNSGFGDGSYTAYWGLAGRRIVNLVIDFQVIANGLHAPAVPKAAVGDSMEYEPA